MPRIIQFTFLTALMLLCYIQCKEKQNGIIPYVPVNAAIGLNLPTFAPLLPIGGVVSVDGYGSKGLIIFHRGPDEYVVYDRNCTYNAFSNCATVKVNPSLAQAVDTCCGSKFSLQTGLVLQGPATVGLVQYQTDLQGQTLYIYN